MAGMALYEGVSMRLETFFDNKLNVIRCEGERKVKQNSKVLLISRHVPPSFGDMSRLSSQRVVPRQRA